MRKIGLILFSLFLFPSISFGALATDQASYNTPATVGYSGASNLGADIYVDGTSMAIAYQESVAIPNPTGQLNTVTWASGGFNGLSTGHYHFIQPNVYTCGPNARTWTECVTNNPSAPTVDFDITTTTSDIISSTTQIMSPQLDQMLRMLIEAIFVIMGLTAGYLLLKNHRKK